ncbi:MAG: glycosyltransferase family 2 protein, partial [Deltaproteobacteria bacterium]
FLNNDTEVRQKEWLEKLVEQLLLRPGCAAVGPRLVYPDGRVQSAGIEMEFTDGGRSFYQAREIREPLASRYVEGLTAACMLVRKDVFDLVGGFDERFWYGQEDVDFCLRLRARGFHLYHCSEVEVIHHEMATRNMGPYMFSNKRSIRKKWNCNEGALVQFQKM